MAKNAASSMAFEFPMNVTTVLLVSEPGSTSKRVIPSTLSIESVISFILARSRPSLNLGIHSTRLLMLN